MIPPLSATPETLTPSTDEGCSFENHPLPPALVRAGLETLPPELYVTANFSNSVSGRPGERREGVRGQAGTGLLAVRGAAPGRQRTCATPRRDSEGAGTRGGRGGGWGGESRCRPLPSTALPPKQPTLLTAAAP